jgi:membrane protease YdiL (CAAX protease family)
MGGDNKYKILSSWVLIFFVFIYSTSIVRLLGPSENAVFVRFLQLIPILVILTFSKDTELVSKPFKKIRNLPTILFVIFFFTIFSYLIVFSERKVDALAQIFPYLVGGFTEELIFRVYILQKIIEALYSTKYPQKTIYEVNRNLGVLGKISFRIGTFEVIALLVSSLFFSISHPFSPDSERVELFVLGLFFGSAFIIASKSFWAAFSLHSASNLIKLF